MVSAAASLVGGVLLVHWRMVGVAASLTVLLLA
jgi:hypothetical protein